MQTPEVEESWLKYWKISCSECNFYQKWRKWYFWTCSLARRRLHSGTRGARIKTFSTFFFTKASLIFFCWLFMVNSGELQMKIEIENEREETLFCVCFHAAFDSDSFHSFPLEVSGERLNDRRKGRHKSFSRVLFFVFCLLAFLISIEVTRLNSNERAKGGRAEPTLTIFHNQSETGRQEGGPRCDRENSFAFILYCFDDKEISFHYRSELGQQWKSESERFSLMITRLSCNLRFAEDISFSLFFFSLFLFRFARLTAWQMTRFKLFFLLCAHAVLLTNSNVDLFIFTSLISRHRSHSIFLHSLSSVMKSS